jgi:hypothetical protein
LEIGSHVENEIFSVIRKMMGATPTDMTTTTYSNDKYYIDDNYMGAAVGGTY